MKLNYKSFLFLFMTFAMTGIFASCSEDENLPNGGVPMINYIRVTDPDASDSLLTMAGQGKMIAIMGQNLKDARSVWVNDRQAPLIPTYITNTTIITKVPSIIPSVISNKMKIIFSNGDSLLHDFVVDIGEPEADYMISEFVNTGDVATIRGNYFYEPLTVTFTGGVTGEVVLVEDDKIEVTVPEGAEPGPITVTTNFGEVTSNFWFRDNRNVIANFEDTDFEGWWHGPDFIVSSDPKIPAVDNKFLRIDRELAAWGWFEIWVGNGGTILESTKNIPAEAFSNPKNYTMKFEINTLGSLTGAELRMYIGPDMGGERNNINYNWKPNIDTNGSWQTVAISFEEILKANTTLKYDPTGYGVSFHFSGPLAVHANFGLDNIRVVPNE